MDSKAKYSYCQDKKLGLPSTGPLLLPAYLVGATALTESWQHGWHALDRRGLFVILWVRSGHAVTDVFGVGCGLNLDSFASLR